MTHAKDMYQLESRWHTHTACNHLLRKVVGHVMKGVCHLCQLGQGWCAAGTIVVPHTAEQHMHTMQLQRLRIMQLPCCQQPLALHVPGHLCATVQPCTCLFSKYVVALRLLLLFPVLQHFFCPLEPVHVLRCCQQYGCHVDM
jgi:hypothetical protein